MRTMVKWIGVICFTLLVYVGGTAQATSIPIKPTITEKKSTCVR